MKALASAEPFCFASSPPPPPMLGSVIVTISVKDSNYGCNDSNDHCNGSSSKCTESNNNERKHTKNGGNEPNNKFIGWTEWNLMPP